MFMEQTIAFRPEGILGDAFDRDTSNMRDIIGRSRHGRVELAAFRGGLDEGKSRGLKFFAERSVQDRRFSQSL